MSLLLILVTCRAASAQTVTTIYAFQGSPTDGQQPGGVVAGPGGVLYGFAGGGASNDGIVFSLTPPSSSGGAWSETVLYNFTGEPGDGSGPISLATGTDSHGRFVLYGLTGGGGTQKGGTAFMMTPPASPGAPWSEAVIYDFPKLPGYAHPFPLLLNGGLAVGAGADGRPVLYGTTFEGGSGTCKFPSMGCGMVYALAPPASGEGLWDETVIHSFMDNGSDGTFPLAGVVIAGGPNGIPALYGTTAAGGAGGGGMAFSLTPPASAGGTWTETVLANFRMGAYLWRPNAGLTMGTGPTGFPILFGNTQQGGNSSCPNEYFVPGCGGIFTLEPPATAGGSWTRHFIYYFSPVCCTFDAYSPTTAMVFTSGPSGQGVLYGTSNYGGSTNTGAIYALTLPASHGGGVTEELVYSFTGSNGLFPGTLVVGKGGVLYGVATQGGDPYGDGLVFSVQP